LNETISPFKRSIESNHEELKEKLLNKEKFDEFTNKSEEHHNENKMHFKLLIKTTEETKRNSQIYQNNLNELINNLSKSLTERILELLSKAADIHFDQKELLIQNERFSVVQENSLKS
jgi:hypothetical protein